MNGRTEGRTLVGLVLVALAGFPISGVAQGVSGESGARTGTTDAVVEVEEANLDGALTTGADAGGGDVWCMICISDGETHWFLPIFCLGGSVGPLNCVRCGGTSSCHFEPQSGGCHIPCGWEWPSQEDLAQTAKTLVEDAGSYGPDVSVVALVSLINENARLEFNQARKAVQLVDCRGDVVGQWRVSDDTAVALAQHVT